MGWASGGVSRREETGRSATIGVRSAERVRGCGRVEAETEIGGRPAIIPSVEGSAIATGLNEIWIDDEDVFAHGFQVV